MKSSSNGWTMNDWIKAAKSSRYFDTYKVYVIECYDEKERFIKIGRTFCPVHVRYFDAQSLPYKYEILHEICDDNPYHIYRLEGKLKREYKEMKYKPEKPFKGSGECFSIQIKESLKQRFNVNP
jgi:hypothetical protein